LASYCSVVSRFKAEEQVCRLHIVGRTELDRQQQERKRHCDSGFVFQSLRRRRNLVDKAIYLVAAGYPAKEVLVIARLIAFPLAMALLISSTAFSQGEHRTNETFRVKLVTQTGEDKWQARDVMLSFEHGRMVLRTPKNEAAGSFNYSDIKSVEYSHTRTRRKVGTGTAAAANVFALPLMLKEVDEHWLTVHLDNDQTFLSLDKDNYNTVLAAFESNAGMKVAGWSGATVAVGR
jgi:hypothetical protein